MPTLSDLAYEMVLAHDKQPEPPAELVEAVRGADMPDARTVARGAYQLRGYVDALLELSAGYDYPEVLAAAKLIDNATHEDLQAAIEQVIREREAQDESK